MEDCSSSFSTIYTNLMDTSFFSLISQTSTDIIRNLLHVQVNCLFEVSAS